MYSLNACIENEKGLVSVTSGLSLGEIRANEAYSKNKEGLRKIRWEISEI